MKSKTREIQLFLYQHRKFFAVMALTNIGLVCIQSPGCTGFDSLAGTILAILGGVNIVLATIGAAIPSTEVTAIEGGVTIAENAITALKATVDDYEKNKGTGTGTVDTINAAIAAVQQSLSGLLAAAQIKNTALQAWIGKIVTLVGAVVQEVVTDILPNVKAALTDKVQAESLNTKMHNLANKLKADHDAALDESGLPADAVAATHKHVNHATEHYIGPIHI